MWNNYNGFIIGWTVDIENNFIEGEHLIKVRLTDIDDIDIVEKEVKFSITKNRRPAFALIVVIPWVIEVKKKFHGIIPVTTKIKKLSISFFIIIENTIVYTNVCSNGLINYISTLFF